MTTAQKLAYDRGFQDGKRDWSGSNEYTFSVLIEFYSKGYAEGSAK